jgi:hypothetical protein
MRFDLIAAHSTSWTDILSAIAAGVAAFAGLATLALVVLGTIFARRGIEYARTQIQEATRSRHAQLVIELARAWEEEGMATSRKLSAGVRDAEELRELVQREYLANSEKSYELLRLPTFFEDLATLEDEKAVSIAIVYKQFGSLITHWYRLWEPAVLFLQQHTKRGDVYAGFQRLATRITEYEREHPPPPPPPSPPAPAAP